jgi:hypothetical protein
VGKVFMEPVLCGQSIHGTCTLWAKYSWNLYFVGKVFMEPVLCGQSIHGTCTLWAKYSWNLYFVGRNPCAIYPLAGDCNPFAGRSLAFFVFCYKLRVRICIGLIRSGSPVNNRLRININRRGNHICRRGDRNIPWYYERCSEKNPWVMPIRMWSAIISTFGRECKGEHQKNKYNQ